MSLKRREMLEKIGSTFALAGLFQACGNPAENTVTVAKKVLNQDQGVTPLPGSSEGAAQCDSVQASVATSPDSFVSKEIFTAAAPLKWKGKEGSHAPKVSVIGGKLRVENLHGMKNDHYILWHQVRNDRGVILAEKQFAQPAIVIAVPPAVAPAVAPVPAPAPVVSEYDLATLGVAVGGKVWIYSFCNQHGVWKDVFTIVS